MSTGADNDRWFVPRGSTAADGWETVITVARPGWQYAELRVATLVGDDVRRIVATDREHIVIPLSGSVVVTGRHYGEQVEHELSGRTDVFAGATDTAYLPRDWGLTVAAVGERARVAIAGAVTPGHRTDLTPRYLPADEVPDELRGAGVASRRVRNFGTTDVLDAESIIACEVITPAGNWSSWPPHKHDEEKPGTETALEEIYWFETRGTDPRVTDPIGYQRVYGTEDRRIDVLAEVRAGDAVLVPHGWHGPAIAAPDADLYYLNVMAGPGPTRAWLISDDPAHAWVREAWTTQPLDPRLTASERPDDR